MMANVIVKGVCYDLDGKTPLTAVKVTVNIKDTKLNLLATKDSSTADGSYNITYDNTKLQTDNQIVIEYKRADSGTTLTINGLSGFNANPQTLNPVPPKP
jgi:hypothetical protein